MTSTTTDRHAIWQLQPLPGLEVLSPQARQLLAPPFPQMHWPFAAMGTLAREKQHEISLAPSSGTDPLTTVSEAREEHLRPPNLDRWLVDPLPTDFWASWLQRNGPLSVKPICLYVAGCPPLGRLRDAFSASVFKPGTTSNLQRRLRTLNSSQYASWTAQGDSWTREDGFNAWSFEPTRIDRLPSSLSPIVINTDHIEVRLPRHLTAKAFEDELNQHLRAAAVDNWVRQPGVSQALKRRSIDPSMGIRATEKVRKAMSNLRETSELMFFRRRCDWQALAAIAEHILSDSAQPRAC
ncbi:MAG: hypothetical protein FD152_395 [Xanthobacteraceae bacterium]|nr:MAG: hypothetical protein FD152_395 [Xanthobacteraceae bacterium]